MDEGELQAFRKAFRVLQDRHADAPPSDEELAALVSGELGGDERNRVIERMLESPDAIEKHKILEELHAERAKRSSPGRSWGFAVGFAACLLVPIFIWTARSAEEPAGPAARRSPDHRVSPPVGAKLDAPPKTLRWEAPSEAEQYEVKLRDEAAVVIWRSEPTRETRVALPPEIRARLELRGTYLWTVEGSLDGHAFELGPYSFEVTAAPDGSFRRASQPNEEP